MNELSVTLLYIGVGFVFAGAGLLLDSRLVVGVGAGVCFGLALHGITRLL